MAGTSLKNIEKSLKWDKKKVDKAIEQLILARAKEIVEVQIEAATSGSLQAGQYLIDRTFGKARQNIGLDGGQEGSPIVFMPSTLVDKFKLNEPIKKIGEIDIIPAEENEKE